MRTIMRFKLFSIFAILFASAAFAQNPSTHGNIVSGAATCQSSNCVYYQLPPNTPYVVVTISGTWSGTIAFQSISAPNANYSNLNSVPWTNVATEIANGNWSVATGGATFLLIQAPTWSSGSAQVSMFASQTGSPMNNPVFPGTITATGLQAPDAGSPTEFWQTNGGHAPSTGWSGGCSLSNPPSCTGIPGPVINVMAAPYSATGDCSTDDHNAITAAMVAANASGIPVFFPAPPGGCYLTSTLTWLGVSLQGQQPVGINPPTSTAGVIIKGKPSSDVFHAPDPTTVTTAAPRISWSIRDIVFEVDDSVNASASFPHRWPGRWVQDAGMIASSAVITSPHALFTGGDVGQAIQVNGAGVGGANLVTTIASVFPHLGEPNLIQTVTLANAASTTVSGAAAYISVAGLPVTQHVGNAALAFDCKDGNSADYTMASIPQSNVDELTNVKFYGLSNASQNYSAGLYMQGCYAPYNMVATNTTIQGTDFGAVFGVSDSNSYDNPQGLQDFMNWQKGEIEAGYPWISYNGGGGKLDDVQIYTASGYGPQILNAGEADANVTGNWYIHVPEMEGPVFFPGFRITGDNERLVNTPLGGIPGTLSNGPIWDAYDSVCEGCYAYGTFQVNGSRNRIDLASEQDAGVVAVANNGNGNQVGAIGFEANPVNGQSASRRGTLAKSILDQPVGIQTTDFIRSGNMATPYPNDNDLIFGPTDFSMGGANQHIVADATALFGNYIAPGNWEFTNFFSLYMQNQYGQAFIGTQIPATQAIVYAAAKCPSSTSFTATVYANSTVIGSTTATCSTSYNVAAVPVNFTSYVGEVFGIGITSTGDAEWEYVAIRPYQADYNGKQPVLSAAAISTTGSGAAVPTGPASSVSGDLVTYIGTSGQQQDSGTLLSSLTAKAGTGACTSGQFETGDTTSGPSCATPSTGSGTFVTLSGDATSTATGGATTVQGLKGVPFCTGFTPTNGQAVEYTTGGTPNPCYSAATPSGSGTVTDGSGTTTTPEFAESTSTAHVQQYRTASQALGDMGAQASLSLLAGTYTNGDWCSYTSSGTLLNCNNAVPQPALSLLTGTYTNGDLCTYTTSGTLLNCNLATSTFDASGAAAARAAVGSCSAGQYVTATTTSGVTCAGIATVQLTMPTSLITANTCTTPATVTMTGLAAPSGATPGSTFTVAYEGNPNAITGWGSSGGLSLKVWVSATSTASWSVCDVTGSDITPGALKVDVGAK